MTTKSKADLDKLKAMAQAATPGPWTSLRGWEQQDPGIWISCAWGHGGRGCEGVLYADGYDFEAQDVLFTEADADYIAAASPDVILELIEELVEYRERWCLGCGWSTDACPCVD